MDIFKILLVFSVCVFTHQGYTENNYFCNPYIFSSEELTQQLEKKTLDMCWNFGKDSHFRFVTGNHEVYIEICLGTLSERYNDFVARVKDKFIERSNQLIFTYKMKSDGTEEIHIPQMGEHEDPDGDSYIVSDRRVLENTNPQRMYQDELETIIRTKDILFYTGAGISLASEIPAMNELNELLGFQEGEMFVFSLENVVEKPREFASKVLTFHKACLYSAPTKAHFALKELAIFKNIRLITENLDCLHEASGIFPYRIDPKHLREKVGGEYFTHVDYIICIGLSHDDHGFLGWYKKQNPFGKIIAVDLNQPSYLGDEDYLIRGDLQELIPSIQKKIANFM